MLDAGIESIRTYRVHYTQSSFYRLLSRRQLVSNMQCLKEPDNLYCAAIVCEISVCHRMWHEDRERVYQPSDAHANYENEKDEKSIVKYAIRI